MRQYVSQNPLDKDGLLTIDGKDYRYLKQVLRLTAGDMVSVRFSDSALQNMTVSKISEKEKKIILQVCDSFNAHQENQPGELSPTEFFLFMFVPKSSKFDLIVRQATECGVKEIHPVSSSFSQKGAEKMNFRGERFERIIKEARQQSGSPVETTIGKCISIQEACDLWKDISSENDFGCVLYERSDFTTDFSAAFSQKDNSLIKKCALVCGAEGGISPQEIKQLMNAGFTPIHLKTNILRCETAALYGMAVLQNYVNGETR